MNQTEILNELSIIFREVFMDESINASLDMTADDIERWDSLSHIDMMLSVEAKFGLRIPTKIISNTRNVEELVDFLISKNV